ncbi:hypothetical protein M752DRAFT_263747 [Aspergillus phoenicis ATCC 13157]|uniref:Uncharacterized protein n=1 Tax=Aspergillus phoenicis ATCC 13157 TaxID=1353007 RepID=A0A370PRW0_ASPPH|nr:hypothetical protein M752DRAFT_263747 [Aspergillus phoenicis ATCC 13157]
METSTITPAVSPPHPSLVPELSLRVTQTIPKKVSRYSEARASIMHAPSRISSTQPAGQVTPDGMDEPFPTPIMLCPEKAYIMELHDRLYMYVSISTFQSGLARLCALLAGYKVMWKSVSCARLQWLE